MRRWIGHPGIRGCDLAIGVMICGLLLALSGRAFSQAPGQPVPPSSETAPSSASPPAAPLAPVTDNPPAAAPQPLPPVPAPTPARPAGNPGFVEELGKWLKNSTSHFSSGLKSSEKTLQDLNSKTKDATESLTRVQSVVTGRVACPVAANGAPDCNAAAEQLCKSKDFKSGKSLDIETAEKCSARVYLSGRTGAPGECRSENFVTRAVCQ